MQMNHRFIHLLLGFILVLGVIMFINSTFFSITSYEVIYGSLVPELEYIPWEDLLGKNIFHTDLAGLKDIALDHRQIKDVTVKRKLPGTIVYIVNERKPVAAIKSHASYYLTDGEGFIIEKANTAGRWEVPIISWPDAEQLLKDDIFVADSRPVDILKLLASFDSNILIRLSGVDINDEQLTLRLKDGGNIYIGQVYEAHELNQIISNFLSQAEVNYWRIDYLDLRFIDRPVFKLIP